VNFSEYLLSKKIDADAFKSAEPDLWESWKTEFEQISPTGFTAQKLFLINPIRRKYALPPSVKPAIEPIARAPKTESDGSVEIEKRPVVNKPAVPRPVFKIKPKTPE
jgi:hypothetical protein